MWDYPTLYHNRSRVIEHLFIVIGNGYDWIDGQLVETVYGRRQRKAALDEIYADTPSGRESREHFLAGTNSDWARTVREGMELRDKIERKHAICRRTLISAFSQKRRQFSRVYPLSHYAKVVNIPDDIQPDWALGAQEAIDLIRGTKESFYQPFVGTTQPHYHDNVVAPHVMTQEEGDNLHATDLHWADVAQARLDEVLAKQREQARDQEGAPR